VRQTLVTVASAVPAAAAPAPHARARRARRTAVGTHRVEGRGALGGVPGGGRAKECLGGPLPAGAGRSRGQEGRGGGRCAPGGPRVRRRDANGAGEVGARARSADAPDAAG